MRRLALFVVWGLVAASARGQAPLSPLLPPPLPRLEPSGDERHRAAAVSLGKRLFLDARLSRNDRVSCATCHDPAKAFTSGERFATGVDGKRGRRRPPRLMNVAHSGSLFWDGRTATLEEQALLPIQSPDEMDMTLAALVKKLDAIPYYREGFRRTFQGEVTAKRIGQALAAFERTLISDDTPFDRWLKGDRTSLTPAAARGMELFFGEARCSVCHKGPNLSDGKYHNVGVSDADDPGRRAVTRNEKDHGAFRTPQLREVGRTGPYMHDGRLKTLAEVVRHYNFGGVTDERNDHRDEELRVLYLGDDQADDLVAFLRDGLTTPSKKSDSRP